MLLKLQWQFEKHYKLYFSNITRCVLKIVIMKSKIKYLI